MYFPAACWTPLDGSPMVSVPSGLIRSANADSVHHGALPRNLPIHRARINDFARRLERLRAENVDVWLDVMALRPVHHPRLGHLPRRMQGDSLPSPDSDTSDVSPPPPDAE